MVMVMVVLWQLLPRRSSLVVMVAGVTPVLLPLHTSDRVMVVVVVVPVELTPVSLPPHTSERVEEEAIQFPSLCRL